jgi:hypothetical protein
MQARGRSRAPSLFRASPAEERRPPDQAEAAFAESSTPNAKAHHSKGGAVALSPAVDYAIHSMNCAFACPFPQGQERARIDL